MDDPRELETVAGRLEALGNATRLEIYRLLVRAGPEGLAVGQIQAAFLGLLPKPPMTRDQLLSLKTDSVVSEGALTLADLEVQATALEAIVPTYLHRYRRGGRLGRTSAV